MALLKTRKHSFPAVLAPLFVVGLILTAAAAEGPPSGLAPRSPQGPVARPGLLEVPRETLSPRLLEIRELLEDRAAKLGSLTRRFTAAGDDAEAVHIQREIHDLKRGTEVEILKIQLRHARLEENREAVTNLEAALERVERGPVILPPESRPRPESNR